MLLLLPVLSLLLLTSLETSANIQIGTIRTAWWNQSTTSVWNWTTSCNECICAMVMSFWNVVGLNCLVTSRTCYLFANYSTDSPRMTSNATSTFYFRTLPPTSTPAPMTTAETEQFTSKIRNITKLDSQELSLQLLFVRFCSYTRYTFNAYFLAV
jgi:hypothetical protein